MTAIELREIAVEIPGVTGAHAMKKEQLLEVIKEARGIKDEEPAKKGKKKKASKDGKGTKELKKKIFQLKEMKKEARDARDRDRVDILRRRINRLKKRTRKVAQA
ncbi:MAG: transcription termination factor Rho [Deltaproteobacteria bacterium]|nr:transcription termination factor Rho [Deltaproteobacteria bacterium]